MVKNSLNKRIFTLNCKGRLVWIDRPKVMGILNITPDSFYQGSRYTDLAEIETQAGDMINDGADFIDIGGQSTRPGSIRISADEEVKRIIPAIEHLHQKFPELIISVDTYQAEVAKKAVDAGAHIINDVSGGVLDPEVINVAAEKKVPFICMHMKGSLETMQDNANYVNLTREVLQYFIERIKMIRQAGVDDIIIDPGFGFAKTIGHNFQLLQELELLHILECPVLVGLSRKSTIYKTLGITADEALNGTTVLNTIALLKGASILRVHDVKEAKQAITLLEHYMQ